MGRELRVGGGNDGLATVGVLRSRSSTWPMRVLTPTRPGKADLVIVLARADGFVDLTQSTDSWLGIFK